MPAFREKCRHKSEKVEEIEMPNTERELKKDHEKLNEEEEPTPRS